MPVNCTVNATEVFVWLAFSHALFGGEATVVLPEMFSDTVPSIVPVKNPALKCTDKTGRVAAIKSVDDNDEVMLISVQGIIIRLNVSGISEIGRNTQGVRVMKLDDNDKLIDAALILNEKDPEIPEVMDNAKNIHETFELPSEDLLDEWKKEK